MSRTNGRKRLYIINFLFLNNIDIIYNFKKLGHVFIDNMKDCFRIFGTNDERFNHFVYKRDKKNSVYKQKTHSKLYILPFLSFKFCE